MKRLTIFTFLILSFFSFSQWETLEFEIKLTDDKGKIIPNQEIYYYPVLEILPGDPDLQKKRFAETDQYGKLLLTIYRYDKIIFGTVNIVSENFTFVNNEMYDIEKRVSIPIICKR